MDPLELLNSLEAGVAAISPGWKIASWSPSAARLTGRPADEVLGAELWAAFPATRRAEIEQTLEEVLADGNPRTVQIPGRASEGGRNTLEIEACRAAGAHLLLLIRLAPGQDGENVVGAGSASLDTEGKLYDRLFEVLPMPAFVLTPEGRVVKANRAGAGLLGVPSAAALRGRALADWVRGNELTPALEAAKLTPQRITVAVEIPGGDAIREAQLILTATDTEQASPRLLCLASDVSREILLQRRLLQSDRLSQLGALVSGVAHELNNPLASIAAFAELLKAEKSSPAVGESAAIIHSEAMRAGRIIRTLLDFARHQPRALQPVAVPEIVDRVLALQRSALRKWRITTSVGFGSQLPTLRADPRELQQVLLNAVSNAGQAIASTGKPGQITVSARPSDGHVVVSVEDSGPGVDPEVLDRAFEPFFTTKGEEGTGLGLSISFGLIRAMGGRIWLQNVEGSGARLSFELPIDGSAPPAVVPGEVQPASRPLKVLIVEDRDPLRRGMELMASRLGHQPVTAATFAEARSHLFEGTEEFDALLMDVHLDGPHSGFDLFTELTLEGKGRERLAAFTTGDSISAQTRDRLERADRPVLRKPFALDELHEVLDRLGCSR
jgi:signal transduction histidine kinase